MLRPSLLSRAWSRPLCFVGALGVLLFMGESASAQVTRDFDVERFSPAPDGDGFLTMPGTRTPGPWRWNVGFSLAYARDPLAVNTTPSGVITDRLDGNLYAQLGIGGTLAVVVQAPVVLYQSGAAERIDGGPALMASAIRDARVALRWRLFGEDATVERERHEGEGLALQIAGTIPFGQRGTFAGEGLPQLEGAVLGDFHLLDIGIGGMLGFRHRFAEPMLFESRFRNELFGLIAIQVPLFFVDHVVAITEFDVTTDAENLFGDAGSTPSEWRLGLRVSAIRDVQITVMGGTAMTQGVGAPLARGIVQLSWAPRVHDRDQDGIVDDQDRCQTLPEDFDSHEDEDGCPEPDNDGDLVPDLDDACPNEAATFGTDLNDDGCNDPIVDTDQDGVVDGVDACPEEAEDRDGFEDDDGCPDIDNDHDGVVDASDRCPTEAETLNGVADDDGCPDRGGRTAWTALPLRADVTQVWTARIQWSPAGVLAASSTRVLREAALRIVSRAPREVEILVAVDAAQEAAVLASIRSAIAVALRDAGVPEGMRFRLTRTEVSRADRSGALRLQDALPSAP